jgi:hypothetical protein
MAGSSKDQPEVAAATSPTRTAPPWAPHIRFCRFSPLVGLGVQSRTEALLSPPQRHDDQTGRGEHQAQGVGGDVVVAEQIPEGLGRPVRGQEKERDRFGSLGVPFGALGFACR